PDARRAEASRCGLSSPSALLQPLDEEQIVGGVEGGVAIRAAVGRDHDAPVFEPCGIRGVKLAPQLSLTRCEVEPEDLSPERFRVPDEEGITIGAPLSDPVIGLESGGSAGLAAVEGVDQGALWRIAERLLPVWREDSAFEIHRRERFQLLCVDVQRVRSEIAALLPHDE